MLSTTALGTFALLAASVLALADPALAGRLEAWRRRQTEAVGERPEDEK